MDVDTDIDNCLRAVVVDVVVGGGPLPTPGVRVAGRAEEAETDEVRLERVFGPGDLAPDRECPVGDIIPGDIGLIPVRLTDRFGRAIALRDGGLAGSARLGNREDCERADRDGGRGAGRIELASPEDVVGIDEC